MSAAIQEATGQSLDLIITVAGFATNLDAYVRCTLNVPTALKAEADKICEEFVTKYGHLHARVVRGIAWSKGERIDFSVPSEGLSEEDVNNVAEFFVPYAHKGADSDMDYGMSIGGARMFVCGSRFVTP